MGQFNLSISIFLIINFAGLCSCAQNVIKQDIPASTVYVGSTPCDFLIRAELGIPASVKCEFIKWQLSLAANESDSFHLYVNYGESKPNTNGFMRGGEKIEARGTYTFTSGTNENPKASVLNLNAPEFKSPLLLIVLDNNILHFADPDKQLLTGNGGYGYLLNRIIK